MLFGKIDEGDRLCVSIAKSHAMSFEVTAFDTRAKSNLRMSLQTTLSLSTFLKSNCWGCQQFLTNARSQKTFLSTTSLINLFR